MKITIEVSEKKLECIRKYLARRAMLIQALFDNPTLEDEILACVYDAATEAQEKQERGERRKK